MFGEKNKFLFSLLEVFLFSLFEFFLIFICRCSSFSLICHCFFYILLVVASFVSDSFSRLHFAFSVLDSSNFYVNSPSIFTGFESESPRLDDSRSEVVTTRPSKPLMDTLQMALINQDITMSIEAYRRSPKC